MKKVREVASRLLSVILRLARRLSAPGAGPKLVVS
jgi:hypothetical protein